MGRPKERRIVVLALAALWGCASGSAEGFESGARERTVRPPPSEPPAATAFEEGTGVYSVEQAARGREAFVETCVECHASSEFRGRDFEFDWRRRTAWDLYRQLRRTMPDDFPGTLAPQTYVDIIAYVLELNDYTPGGPNLSPDEASLRRVPLGPGANRGGS